MGHKRDAGGSVPNVLSKSFVADLMPGPTVREQLWRDPVLLVSVIVHALVLLALTRAGVEGFASTALPIADTAIAVLTVAALLIGRSKVKSGRERRFWDLLAVAWTCWVIVDFLYFFEPSIPLISTSSATDAFFLIYYLLFALAVDLRPHLERPRSLALLRRRLESAAGLVAIFGLLIYFGLEAMPEPLGFSLGFVSRAEGLTPFLLVRLSLDLLLLSRLLHAAYLAHLRWRRLYLLLSTVMFLYAVRDAVSVLTYEQMLSMTGQSFSYQAFLYLPGFLVIVAARARHLSITNGRARELTEEKESKTEMLVASPVALYALVIPSIHFLLYPLGLLNPAVRTGREVFGLLYVVVVGLIAAVHQRVTEKDRQRAIGSLRAAEEQLVRSQRLESIGRLAGGIAHDFNNYLTVISGYAELLRYRIEDHKSRSAIEAIEDVAGKAAHLTRQLLAFGRRQVLRPEALDLNRVVQDTRRILESLVGEDIVLDIELDPELGLARADVGQTEQVLVNLAVNSRDSMPGGGRISIRTRPIELQAEAAEQLGIGAGSYVGLFVSDTGCGISREDRAHVFEPFFTTKEAGRGTGLGLSTVYGIVTQSGGAISLESSVGRGTEVTVLLPTQQSVRTQKPESGLPVPTQGAATVFVVEDQQEVARMAEEALDRGGFRVLRAASGREALERFALSSARIDLLVTDVVMPGMNGVELAAELLRRQPGLRVLFVSGYPAETHRQRQLELPSTIPLLEKPYTPSSLVAEVARVLAAPPPGEMVRASPEKPHSTDVQTPDPGT